MFRKQSFSARVPAKKNPGQISRKNSKSYHATLKKYDPFGMHWRCKIRFTQHFAFKLHKFLNSDFCECHLRFPYIFVPKFRSQCAVVWAGGRGSVSWCLISWVDHDFSSEHSQHFCRDPPIRGHICILYEGFTT